MTARSLLLPLRRLKGALQDAAAGDVDFLISHQRKDEFGELYDSFNAFAVSVQSRDQMEAAPEASETVILDAPADDATVIAPHKLAVVSR